MKILITTFFLLFIISCKKEEISATQMVTCNLSPTLSNTSKYGNNYQAIIDKYHLLGLPGISVLIEDKTGIWLGSNGYADLQNHIPFKPCHVSKIASINKLLMGVLTFKLQEKGLININDPLSKYIDVSILNKIDKAEGKTIRQCMNHTTGIYDVISGNDFYLAVLNNPNKQWSATDLLSYVYGKKGYELTPYPAHYSNTNTILLSLCIEKATGINHSKLLHDLILDPLNMNQSFYQGHDQLPNTTAQGYYDLHNNGTIVNVSNLITGSGNGYGGVFSNTIDMFTFHKALFIEKTLLSQTSLDTMMNFVQSDDDYFTGIGMVKKFTKKSAYGIGHTGRDLGYSADLFYFPAKQASMIFFVNYGTNGKSSLKQVFLDFENDLVDEIIKN